MTIYKSGFLIINKPSGPTSHDIIDQLRKITNIKKIGHAGTLDPFASGVLIVAIGREATREISQFVKLDKKYIATLYLGANTDTYDKTGKRTERYSDETEITENQIQKITKDFIGQQKQIPPMYSAKKIKGKKLYELARKGIEIKREPVKIEIYNIKLLEFKWPYLKIKIHCTSGTYIRSLAYDLGTQLGCGAYLDELERVAVGNCDIKQAIDLRDIDKNNWIDHLINS
ncbi:tRNA pseudouridine(55) synthase TruB [Patescibacteria group bacterium]